MTAVLLCKHIFDETVVSNYGCDKHIVFPVAAPKEKPKHMSKLNAFNVKCQQ